MPRLARTQRWGVILALTAASLGKRSQAESRTGDTEAKNEFTPAPFIGGNSDRGIGGGVIASFARVRAGAEPFLYRFEMVSATMVKSENGSLKVPYQDAYLLFVVPNLLDRRVRLQLRASYTQEMTLKYYGIGNASRVPASRSLEDPLYEYDRTHPTLSAKGRILLEGSFFLTLGLSYTHNWLVVADQSLLSLDGRNGAPAVRALVTTFEPHGVMTFSYGAEFDTRDNEVSPVRGQYHATRIDLSPGGAGVFPQRWGRSNTSLRWFFPIGRDGSAVAARLVGDLLLGDPPVYELSRFDETGALGGPSGVRGVPGQRYHGMVKVFGNIEARKMLLRFHFLGKDNSLQMAAFVDVGRLWAAYAHHAELDGTSLGLKLGLGGGPRLVAGKSFVLRGDVAWSPDARPVGAYLAAGHAF